MISINLKTSPPRVWSRPTTTFCSFTQTKVCRNVATGIYSGRVQHLLSSLLFRLHFLFDYQTARLSSQAL